MALKALVTRQQVLALFGTSSCLDYRLAKANLILDSVLDPTLRSLEPLGYCFQNVSSLVSQVESLCGHTASLFDGTTERDAGIDHHRPVFT